MLSVVVFLRKHLTWVIFLFQMRNYIRKTARVQNVTRENVSKAIDMVRNHNWGVVDAAREFKLSERSIFRYLSKVSANKEFDVDEDSLPLTCAGYSSRKVIMFKQLLLVYGELTRNFFEN